MMSESEICRQRLAASGLFGRGGFQERKNGDNSEPYFKIV